MKPQTTPLSGLLAGAVLCCFPSLVSANGLQWIPGPVSVTGGGPGVLLIDTSNDLGDWLSTNPAGNGLALTDANATGTYYFGFDWTITNNSGETGGGGFFGGLWLYQDGAERPGFGNGWGPMAYGIAGPGGDALASPTTLYSVGQKVRLVAKIQYMAGGDEIITLWVNPNGGQAEGSQSGVPVVTTTRNAAMNRVRLRTGNGSGASTLERLMISTDFASAAAWDLDGDGMADGWERRAGLNPTLNDAAGDPDADGLSNLQEYLAGTNPFLSDTDGDGLSDGQEVLVLNTNPLLVDTDGDTLSDAVETNTGVYVNENNTGTNPLLADTDGDGYDDGLEVRLGSNPLQSASTPASGNLDLVGMEHFDYLNGTAIAGRSGGEAFDYDNSTESGIFTGHTGSSSSWQVISGNPQVEGGKLITGGFFPRSSGSALRRFNGPGTGNAVGSDERAGVFSAVNIPQAQRQTLYFRVNMRRTSQAVWSGVSLYQYGSERIFIGVPGGANPATGRREFCIDEKGGTVDFSGVAAQSWQSYRLVGKVDLPSGLVSIWVDPDLGAGEGANPVLLSRTHSNLSNLDLTGIRLGSDGRTEWDELVVATTWSGLSTAARDGDSDGLRDTWEIAHGLDFESALGDEGAAGDPDEDGVANMQEQQRGSHPLLVDTDGDGLPDSVETNTGVWVSASDRGSNPASADSDLDGLGDLVETNTGVFVDANDTGTNPNLPDTDGDGGLDGAEVLYASNPLDPASLYGGDRKLVGADNFDSYADGSIADMQGGSGFDYDNSRANDFFIGHTGTSSDWDVVFGSPGLVGGKLRTQDSGAKREFNGPEEGSGPSSDERFGAVNEGDDADRKAVYFRVDLTREANVAWSGLSAYDFGTERSFAGVVGAPNPQSGKFEFSLGSPGAVVYSGIEPVPGQPYTLVVKIDYVADTMSLWVNPDLKAAEGPPTLTNAFTITNWTTAVRLASGGAGACEWDNLVVGYDWSALGVFPGQGDGSGGGGDFATWIAGFPGVGAQNGLTDDPDADGLPNAIEQILGGDPTAFTVGLTALAGSQGVFRFRHHRSNEPASDITASYEWSTDMQAWHASGASNAGGVTVSLADAVVEDRDAPETDLVEVTATVTAGQTGKLFVRLVATQQPPGN